MSGKLNILIVEDEKSISNFMKTILKANGYEALTAKDGGEALMMASSYCPDLAILDLGLPDMDGQNIIKSIREWSQIPIIVVSARTQERDKVAALDLGADDYITKPFGTSELLARVRTALRHAASGETRGAGSQTGAFSVGALEIDFDKRQVLIDGEESHLTQNEYKIVALLAAHAGSVLTYDNIIKKIWGPNVLGDNRILRVNMANIRRKIEKNPAEPEYIFTEMGVGYKM
ncbi:MAG: response regulator transcription factor, partial [Oscillospiraceae bacterium]